MAHSISTTAKKGGKRKMAGTIRARVTGGTLKPLEKLDLPEGSEVTVTIVRTGVASDPVEAIRRSAGGWKGLVDAKKLIRNIYRDRLVSTRPVPRL
jgi:predicted DNA-binding antitoxin AbrB/MazE fold protein